MTAEELGAKIEGIQEAQAKVTLDLRDIATPYRADTEDGGFDVMDSILTSKTKNVWAFQQGILGNPIRSWANCEDLERSGYSGKVTIRQSAGAGGFCIYDVAHENVIQKVGALRRAGVDIQTLYFNETIDAKWVILQGEIMRKPGIGLILYYSQQQEHMRTALRKDGKHATGLLAQQLIRYTCGIPGYNCIQEWLDISQGSVFDASAVVEFTAFDRAVGLLGWPTVVWEVRKY